MHRQARAALTFNAGSHATEHIDQIVHLRLSSGIFNNSCTLSADSGHEQIFSTRYRGDVKIHFSALKAFGNPCFDITLLQKSLHAKLLKTLEVIIDGSGAYGTPTRQRNPGKASSP